MARFGLAVAVALLAGLARAQPAFEVASIRSNASDGNVTITPPEGGRFRATHISLALLIQTAYEVENFQIEGGPKWLRTETFDVDAKAEGNPDLRQIRVMLQRLLKDRFQLAVHPDKKEMAVYVLTVAKGGPKLRPASDPSCQPPPAGRCGGTRIAGGTMSGRNIAMPQLSRVLSAILMRPVLDRTGVGGAFDLQVSYSPESRPGEAPRDSDGAANDPNAGSIFAALREQAGLSLQSQRSQVQILVIDSANEPSDN